MMGRYFAVIFEVIILFAFVIFKGKIEVKVKQSRYRPGVTQRVPGN